MERIIINPLDWMRKNCTFHIGTVRTLTDFPQIQFNNFHLLST